MACQQCSRGRTRLLLAACGLTAAAATVLFLRRERDPR
jgi:hypothetical protein